MSNHARVIEIIITSRFDLYFDDDDDDLMNFRSENMLVVGGEVYDSETKTVLFFFLSFFRIYAVICQAK